MELQFNPYELPSAPTFNYDELKTTLTERCHHYETVVYTDDDIKQAKSDRADLNKLKKALDDERRRLEKEYMAPFKAFKAQIDEIIAIIDKPAALIDARVKEFEQKKKEEKREQIVALFADAGLPDYITLEKVWDESWLNSSVSLSRIKDCLKDVAYRDEKAMSMLNDLPEHSFEAIEYYKDCLDVTVALEKANDLSRLAKAKKAAEEEKVQEEIPFDGMPEPVEAAKVVPAEDEERYWIKFSACMSVKEARKLRSYFEYNKIPFKVEREEN